MAYDIFVEIGSGLDQRTRRRLMVAAYRASRSKAVALVLRGVSPEEADRALDPVVRDEGIDDARLHYLWPEGARSVLRSDRAEERLVLTEDPSWLEDAGGPGVRVESLEAGLRRLAEAGAAHV